MMLACGSHQKLARRPPTPAGRLSTCQALAGPHLRKLHQHHKQVSGGLTECILCRLQF